jgi:hypothetical protein
VRRIRRPLMRRLAMLASRYRDSPLLEAGGAVGRRMPDVELERGPQRRRIHQLMGVRPVALFLDHPPLALDAALGLETVVVGEGAWRDPSGLLARRFGAPRVLIVRPDHYVGWAGEPADAGELARAARMALGAEEGSGGIPG